MKQAISLILALILCLGLCACGSSNAETDGAANKQDNSAQEYVGEWKTNIVDISFGAATVYKVAVIVLNADGTATYRGREATWEYKDGTIHLAVTGGGIAVFGIEKEEEKTVLKFSEYTYYRANEFEKFDNMPALTEGRTELLVGSTYTTANGMVFTLNKAELITEGTGCRFALYIASDKGFDIGSTQYYAANNSAGFTMMNQSRDGNVTCFQSAFVFDKAKVEADAEDFGVFHFTIDGTEYYLSVDAFFE
jgi:hypothetical protein